MADAIPVLAVLTGEAVPFRDGEASAIGKRPVAGPVAVTALGLAGDVQADRRWHGGADKALHHYPHDHYAHWQEALGGHPLLAAPGAFGENISTAGWTDEDVCLGDRFRLGTALVELSHGRQPCWKIDHRFGRPGLLGEVVKTRRAGWYYRVIEPGTVAAGDALALTERVLPEWPIARVFALLIGGGHKREPEAVRALAGMAVLAEAWRSRAVELVGG